MLRNIIANKIFFCISVFVLFISFAFNAFGTVSTEKFLYDFKDSESLIYNQVLCPDSVLNDQLLQNKKGYEGQLKSCDSENLVAYSSQYGLQGKVYDTSADALSKIGVGPVAFLSIANLLTALLSALIFGLLVLWFRNNFGNFVGYCVMVGVCLSPMIVGFSRNLYWALPLLIVPIVYALYFYKAEADKRYNIKFFIGLGVLLIARYLCGYEYASTITIALMAVVGYFILLQKSNLKQYFKIFIITGMVSVLAFTVALGIHVMSLNNYSGSTRNSLHIVKTRAMERTSRSDHYLNFAYDGTKASLNDHYQITNTYLQYESLKQGESLALALIFSVVNYALLPVYNLPISFHQPFATYAQSSILFIMVLSFIFYKRHKIFDKKTVKKVNALYFVFYFGLIGSCSWFILANSHSLVHVHINGILIYLPSAIFGYAILAFTAQSYILKIKKRYG